MASIELINQREVMPQGVTVPRFLCRAASEPRGFIGRG